MMLCAIAGAIGYQSSAWAQAAPALAQLQYPFYLNPVAIGSSGGIDLATGTTGPSFGGLVVLSTTAGATGGTSGFGYLNPNTGSEYGQQAVFDAIKAGGNSVSPGTPTFQGISSSNAAGVQNAVVGNFNNNVGPTEYYSNWRGIDLTATGPTVGQPSILISPTYLGDAALTGTVGLADYIDWQTGYLGGLSGWQNGDFLYQGSVGLADYIDWQTNYLATAGSLYPGFGSVTQAGPVLPAAGPVAAVPEPATITLLVVPALALVFFGYRRRKAS
jgi:hypothetical protein